MPHILVAGRLHPSGIALLTATPGVTFDHVHEVSEQSYAPLIAQADALILRTQPLSAPTMALAPRLRIVSRHGVGYDAVDLPALTARGIPLTIVGDVNSISVAEHAMLLLLTTAKRLTRADASVRARDWSWRNRLEPSELHGKNLLILGYGRIGQHLARMARGFGMVIHAHDPFLERRGWPEGDASPAPDLPAALGWADYISVHAPKTDRPLLGAAEFARMKPTAILINTARGGTVDESALIAALRENRLAGAGLDVFDAEPPAPDNPLLGMDQVVLTPHIAGLTAECAERMAIACVRNVLDFFAGTLDPALVVNGDFTHAH